MRRLAQHVDRPPPDGRVAGPPAEDSAEIEEMNSMGGPGGPARHRLLGDERRLIQVGLAPGDLEEVEQIDAQLREGTGVSRVVTGERLGSQPARGDRPPEVFCLPPVGIAGAQYDGEVGPDNAMARSPAWTSADAFSAVETALSRSGSEPVRR